MEEIGLQQDHVLLVGCFFSGEHMCILTITDKLLICSQMKIPCGPCETRRTWMMPAAANLRKNIKDVQRVRKSCCFMHSFFLFLFFLKALFSKCIKRFLSFFFSPLQRQKEGHKGTKGEDEL